LTKRLLVLFILSLSWRWNGGYKALCGDEVTSFLAEIQLEQYVPVFREQGFEKMLDIYTLTEEDLMSSMRMDAIGHRRRIMAHADTHQKHLDSPSLLQAFFVYMLYLVLAAALAAVVGLALLTLIVLYSERLRVSMQDLITVAGLIFWCNLRKKQKERALSDLWCKILHSFERLPKDLGALPPSAVKAMALVGMGGDSSSALLRLPKPVVESCEPTRRTSNKTAALNIKSVDHLVHVAAPKSSRRRFPACCSSRGATLTDEE